MVKSVSTFDTEKIVNKLKINNFRGICSKDMPTQIKGNESVIINTQDDLDGGGRHWVCVYNNPDIAGCIYFESFDMRPGKQMS